MVGLENTAFRKAVAVLAGAVCAVLVGSLAIGAFGFGAVSPEHQLDIITRSYAGSLWMMFAIGYSSIVVLGVAILVVIPVYIASRTRLRMLPAVILGALSGPLVLIGLGFLLGYAGEIPNMAIFLVAASALYGGLMGFFASYIEGFLERKLLLNSRQN